MQNIEKQIQELELHIPNWKAQKQEISKATVGWQIEHSLLIINAIINAISTSNPAKYKWKFKLIKIYIFLQNKIPRGKAKAPEIVMPANFNEDSLKQHLANTKLNLNKLNSLKNGQYFKHPSFGHLTIKDTIKFIGIHTEHHLKIIRDILK